MDANNRVQHKTVTIFRDMDATVGIGNGISAADPQGRDEVRIAAK
ncbi:MAG TPA: hypothetical protein VJ750_12655 [Rhizomicrobium sp.]|nr:hypothetical protein [Rhizomicrobium sp.]